MQFQIAQFTQELGPWSYILLAILVMVEGPIATLAGAVAASAGLMKPIWVFTAAAGGNLLSDSLWYTLGYLGKMEWLERYGGWFGLRKNLIARVRHDITKHAAKVLVVAKLSLGFVIPALVAMGLARVSVRRWGVWLVLAETLWTGTLVLLGYHFGVYVQTLERGVETAALIGSLVFVAILVFYISHIRKHNTIDGEGT